MSRIRSQHGNVISADFRPRTSLDLTVTVKAETLYTDGLVVLTRATAYFADKPIVTIHTLGDLATGHTVQLNHG
jgi:hypothetical protein